MLIAICPFRPDSCHDEHGSFRFPEFIMSKQSQLIEGEGDNRVLDSVINFTFPY